MNESNSNYSTLDWSDKEPNILDDEESVPREMMRELEEARMEEEEEADHGQDLDGSTDVVLYEDEIASEDVNSDSESLSGPDIDDFEETNGITSIMVKRYDPMCDHNEEIFSVGMRFESHEQFKNAVKRYAVINGFNIFWKKSEYKRMEAGCESGCGWRLYGSWIQNEKTFVIKRVENPHNCNRSLKNRQATATWLAQEYTPKIRARLTYSVAEMQADAKERFALTLNKKKCYRAIWKALSDIRGPIEEQYGILRSYLAELKRVSKEGTFDIEVNPITKVFESFYVGFNELKRGFLAGCRSVIGLDRCFLKTGLKDMLLCAVGRDGNNQMFPIAWAVAEVESEASWTWFLTHLFTDLSIGTGEGWTFISDQQKGLMNAVSRLSPQAEHRNCARHIYANWKKLHKGDALKNLFWRAIRCTFQAEFNIAMADLKEECPKGYEDFIRQGPEHFCKAFIKTGTKCDAVDNNLSETFNGYICMPRAKPIIEMLEGIRTMLMDRMAERSQLMMNRIDPICPRIRMKLEKTKLERRNCIARVAMGNNFEVQVFNNRFVVDLARKTCACREWDLSGIPCKHAISCISFMKFDIDDYVDDCFKKDAYERCYQFSLPAMNGQQMWPEVNDEPIKPPPYRRKRGREKKNRIKDKDERSSDGKKLMKVGVQMRCSNCLQYRHNKKTCKNPTAPKPSKAKRGRPKKPTDAQDSAQASGPSNRDHAIIRQERAQARQGYELFVSETGNSYLRMPGSDRVIDIGGPSFSNGQARASNVQVSPSQSSY